MLRKGLFQRRFFYFFQNHFFKISLHYQIYKLNYKSDKKNVRHCKLEIAESDVQQKNSLSCLNDLKIYAVFTKISHKNIIQTSKQIIKILL